MYYPTKYRSTNSSDIFLMILPRHPNILADGLAQLSYSMSAGTFVTMFGSCISLGKTEGGVKYPICITVHHFNFHFVNNTGTTCDIIILDAQLHRYANMIIYCRYMMYAYVLYLHMHTCMYKLSSLCKCVCVHYAYPRICLYKYSCMYVITGCTYRYVCTYMVRARHDRWGGLITDKESLWLCRYFLCICTNHGTDIHFAYAA